MKNLPPCFFTKANQPFCNYTKRVNRFTIRFNSVVFACAMLLASFCNYTQAQSFGIKASAVRINDCNQNNFFNTSGLPADLIGPSSNVFDNNNFGVHTQNSGSLIFRGAEVRTFKDPVSSNTCSARIYYRVYLQSGSPGAFTLLNLPFLENCNAGSGTYPSGGTCADGDQKWQSLTANINLTSYAPGNYVLEVYYEASGSHTTTSLCDDIVTLNNGGNNYKAFFSIQSPTLSSTNPSSCFGNEGSITIGGLVPGVSYQLTYNDDGVTVGPATFVANASGQIIISGLNHGFYSNFVLQINGCTTNLFTGIILSDPIYVPIFNPIPPFCAGTTPPVLPTISLNGITGTWNPSVVNNQNSGTYTFTPDPNTCGNPVTITITVIQRVTPTFPFGTSLTICAGGSVPTLPNTSTNGITGTWSPSVVDNQNSGVYTFTPDPGECADPTTFTVTVNPNITPTFSFGTSLTICAGGSVPTLPNTSTNGITGIWNPSVVDNQNSGVYTFTPDAGQCALSTTFTVTVNPNVTPTFSFGTSLTICAGGSVPTLPNTSNNGITGTWNPSVVDNQNSGVYTFTPDAGQCALSTTFTVTVNPNITPTFSFGTSLTICAGGSVPTLPNTSNNGITGTWNPSVVDNQNSGVYTFTPDAGQCAVSTTFTVTVNPNVTPTFSFGTSLTICAGGSVPTLPNTSNNGITGTWSPSVVDNQNSGVYTFTPDAGQCATTFTYTVTVNPNVTPTFSFGTSLTICAGGSVPTLPNTSTNGITGTWNPSVVDNQNSGVYTFTPDAGQCALSTTFTVTVNPNVTPTFSFGTSLTICAGGSVPTLLNTSTNGITGTWNPSVVDNQNSGVYTFTPTSGQCAVSTTFAVTVTSNITPTFSFGTTLSICTGEIVPTLPATSDNGITGTWNPSVVSDQTTGTYVFTPAGGGCFLSYTFTVTVNSIVTPVFSFGTFQSICIGSAVPALVNTSTNGISGTWNPSVIDNSVSGTYTFTPNAGQCATTASFTLEANATPSLAIRIDTIVNDGASLPQFNFSEPSGAVINWTNSNTSIGLPASGTGYVPAFTAINMTNDPITGIISATPSIGGCIGLTQGYTITVKPLNKDVFVPNVFSPNGDGKNDILYVYGNYITKVDMRIFNQWGQMIAHITNKTQGWNGTFKGTQQPVGVYVYVLKAELSTGKTVELKGSITIVR